MIETSATAVTRKTKRVPSHCFPGAEGGWHGRAPSVRPLGIPEASVAPGWAETPPPPPRTLLFTQTGTAFPTQHLYNPAMLGNLTFGDFL